MKEPSINATPLSQVSTADLKRIVSRCPGLVPVSRGVGDDPEVSRLYAAILLRERGQ